MTEGLSVREVADEAGVAPSTVRLYARRGLLLAARTAGNARRFGCDAPCRIAITRAAQRAGLDLQSIKSLLADLPDDATTADWDRVTDQIITEAERRIAELRQAIDAVSGRGLCSPSLGPKEVRSRHRRKA